MDHDCDCKNEIKGLRSEISRMNNIQEKFVISQEKLVNDMRENINTLTGEIKEIKASTSGIAKDQDNIKGCITDLNRKFSSHEDRLLSLERGLKTSSTTPFNSSETNQVNTYEDIFREIRERKKRENNVIFRGISEQTAISTNERVANDEAAVLNLISLASKGIPKPTKIIRIGKYKPGKTRSIKVCFNNPEPANILLRSKAKLPDSIRIFSDQTPAQQKHFFAIKDELTKRKNAGEDDITIKYINGIPTIVKSVSKNSNSQ